MMQIHEMETTMIDYQTHHRLREAQGREMAEYLNERVCYWSFGQSVVIMLVSCVQVYVLKNFFADRKEII